MKLDNATLQAYLDGNLSPAEKSRVAAALAQSESAQAELAKLSVRHDWVSRQMANIAPDTPPNARRAWQQWQNSVARPSTMERIGQMKRKSVLKQYQSAIATLAAVFVIAIAFSFAPVRAAAGNFLQIFRVQKVEVVPVDMAQIQSLSDNTDFNALLAQLDPEASIVSGDETPQTLPSLAAAAQAVDFAVLAPANLGEPSEITLHPHTVANISPDRDLLVALFDAADIAIDLPESLDSIPIVITKPDSLMMEWNTADGNLSLLEMRSPQVEYPDDLDLQALGIAGLQLMGLSEAEAKTLGTRIDWANTLVLPIPTDEGVDYREVNINGASGTLFSDTAAEHGAPNSALMWQADGISYFLAGSVSADELLALAASMQ